MLETPPPRADTPFWIISPSYEQSCAVIFVEKMLQHGHMPSSQIDWDRIAWYRPKDYWPFRVPLQPHPGHPGRNWTVEFKSTEQNSRVMQSRSIGGFLFSEQCEFSTLTEVLRGCREYNFPGSKLYEFTPVDPMLTYEIQAMAEEGKLPPGWEVYRANTQCALEAGHVQQSWFNEFFGMVPDEMRETRMTGAWATFGDVVFQGFNPSVHVIGDDVIDFPPGIYHRRAIDWGAGPENAMVCLWAYRNGLGQYLVHDEYWSVDQEATVPDHLEAIAKRHPRPQGNAHYGTTYADPSGKAFIRLAQREYEFDISGACNDVMEGIDSVRAALKVVPALAQPRLFIHKRCENLVREMRTYRWRKGASTGKNPTDARIEPLKRDDHAVDALRYLIHSELLKTGTQPPSSYRRSFDRRRHGIRHTDVLDSRGNRRNFADIWRHGFEARRN